MVSSEELSLSFEQILHLVIQLPDSDKIRLSKELEKYTLDTKITQLLETFRTDELPEETLLEDVQYDYLLALNKDNQADFLITEDQEVLIVKSFEEGTIVTYQELILQMNKKS